mmetsp:Transcript_438/g.1670  ORF Transcript_438/g.1670 Transcript_438/m.1670 type:complete len:431 (-) Transcript_438:114-1406(-)
MLLEVAPAWLPSLPLALRGALLPSAVRDRAPPLTVVLHAVAVDLVHHGEGEDAGLVVHGHPRLGVGALAKGGVCLWLHLLLDHRLGLGLHHGLGLGLREDLLLGLLLSNALEEGFRGRLALHAPDLELRDLLQGLDLLLLALGLLLHLLLLELLLEDLPRAHGRVGLVGAPVALEPGVLVARSDLGVLGPRHARVAVVGSAVRVIGRAGGPAVSAPLGVLGQALRDAAPEELVTIDLELDQVLQVAPLPGDRPGELVVLDVDLTEVREAANAGRKLSLELVLVEVELLEHLKEAQGLGEVAWEAPLGDVHVGDAPVHVVRQLPLRHALKLAALDAVPGSMPVLPARVVGALWVRAGLSPPGPGLEDFPPPGVVVGHLQGLLLELPQRGEILRVGRCVRGAQQGKRDGEASRGKLRSDHGCCGVRRSGAAS